MFGKYLKEINKIEISSKNIIVYEKKNYYSNAT